MAHQLSLFTKKSMKIMALVDSSGGEGGHMTWDEVDLKAKLWIVPAARMKAKQIYCVPLSKQAMAILRCREGQHETLVFPSVRDRSPLSDMTLTAFFAARSGGSAMFLDTQPPRTASGPASATGAGKRSIHATLPNALWPTPFKTRSKPPNHRTDLREQRGPLMQAWANSIAPDYKTSWSGRRS